MRHIVFRSRLQRDLHRMKKRGTDIEKLLSAAKLLAHDGLLSARYRAHKLSGEYAGFWECHIEPDWLLIYAVTETEVFLARTGTHADLFE
jgi:mRNA interferase YafQ